MTDKPNENPAQEAPPSVGVVATDGGPVLLGPRGALTTWAGAPADGEPRGDYHDACQVDHVQAWCGTLDRAGAQILVLPSYVVDVLDPGDGSLWLTLEGMIEELWAARARITFRPLGRTLDATDLVLLDAAYPLAEAARLDERLLALPARAARYALEHGTEAEPGGYFLVLRLRPA